MKTEELKICGLTAVRARFERDAASIRRLYFDLPMSRRIGAMCQALASAKKVYRCVESSELEKIAGTVHHGGIVAVVVAPSWRAPSAAEMGKWSAGRLPVLLLDRIGNAHNLGAIARTAAYFGVNRIVLAEMPGAARPGEAAYRVAEGGMESIEVYRVPDLAAFVGELARRGYEVVGAATRGGRPRVAATGGKPLALVLGNEEDGLSAAVMAKCTRLVTIPGSGKVESLNVSVAAGILLWDLVGRGARADSTQ